MRLDAQPPNMNTTAASTHAATGHPARHPIATTARPPTSRCAYTRISNVSIDGAGSNSAHTTNAGVKISDCGSAMLGMAAVVIRIPERRRAGMQRRRQKAEEGIELVLGIPRRHDVRRQPPCHGGRPDGADDPAAPKQRAPRRAGVRRSVRSLRGVEFPMALDVRQPLTCSARRRLACRNIRSMPDAPSPFQAAKLRPGLLPWNQISRSGNWNLYPGG